MNVGLHAMLSFLEKAASSESFDQGAEALCSYFQDNLEKVEAMMRAETSFSEVDRIYKIFHPMFIQKRFIYSDTVLSDLCITLVKAKVEQKMQIHKLFYAPLTKNDAAKEKIQIFSEVIESITGNSALLASALFRQKLRVLIDEEIESMKKSSKKREITPRVVTDSSQLHDWLDLLFRDTSFQIF